jgi:hypothetical protein
LAWFLLLSALIGFYRIRLRFFVSSFVRSRACVVPSVHTRHFTLFFFWFVMVCMLARRTTSTFAAIAALLALSVLVLFSVLSVLAQHMPLAAQDAPRTGASQMIRGAGLITETAPTKSSAKASALMHTPATAAPKPSPKLGTGTGAEAGLEWGLGSSSGSTVGKTQTDDDSTAVVDFGTAICDYVLARRIYLSLYIPVNGFRRPISGRILSMTLIGPDRGEFRLNDLPASFPATIFYDFPIAFTVRYLPAGAPAGAKSASILVRSVDSTGKAIPDVEIPLVVRRELETFTTAQRSITLPDTLLPFQTRDIILPNFIRNTGTIPLIWDNAVTFRNVSGYRLLVDSITPNPTPVGGSSAVRMRFAGAPAGAIAIFDFSFASRDCPFGQPFSLTIFVRPNPQNITLRTLQSNPLAAVNFGRFLCSPQPRDTTFQIFNSGQRPLVVTSASLAPNSDFTIISPNPASITPSTPFVIDEEGSATMTVRYTPRSTSPAGLTTATLRLLSNASNTSFALGTTLTLSAVRDSTSLALSTRTVDFPLVEQNVVPASQSFMLTNTGTVPLTFAAPMNSGQFTIETITPNTIPPGGAATVTARFNGSATPGAFATSVPFSDACGAASVVVLRAQVVQPAPGIGVASPLAFGTLVCDNASTLNIPVLNVTRANGSPLILTAPPSLTGADAADFAFVPNSIVYPLSIQPAQSAQIPLVFRPRSAGTKRAQIVFRSNAENVPMGVLTVDVSATKDSVGFVLSRSRVDWVNVLPNTALADTLTVLNTGTKPLVGVFSVQPLGTFTIDQAGAVPVGGRAIVRVSFNGGNDDATGRATFSDECGRTQSVALAATILPPRVSLRAVAPYEDAAQAALAPTQTAVSMGTLLCETSTTALLTVSNLRGGKNLVVSGIEFQPPVAGLEVIAPQISAATPLVLGSDRSSQISVRYTIGRDTGNVQTRLVLRSNGVNATDGMVGITTATIRIRRELLAFDIASNFVDFGTLPPNTASNATLTLQNTGTLPIQWRQTPYVLSDSSGNRFRVESITPNPTQPRQEATLTLRFVGAPSGNRANPNDLRSPQRPYLSSTTFSSGFGVDCDLRRSLNLSAIVQDAVATLEVGSAEAAPGDNVEIPIYLRGGRFLSESQLAGFDATLRYNYSVLVPVENQSIAANQSSAAASKGRVAGRNRLFPMRLPLTGLSIVGRDTVLARLRFQATLGSVTGANLSLDSVRALGTALTTVRTDTIPGAFKLVRLCEEGGTRLFGDGTATVFKTTLAQSEPNPAASQATIAFSTIETGPTSLTLYNTLGVPVARLLDTHLSEGSYSVELDAAKLNSGAYFYVLQTPTMRLSKRMEIIR